MRTNWNAYNSMRYHEYIYQVHKHPQDNPEPAAPRREALLCAWGIFSPPYTYIK